jgi:putative transcriptional regulator
LCTALQCSPNDLLEVDITEVEAKPKATRSTRAPAKAARGRSMPPL